jgi:hypothetical protein
MSKMSRNVRHGISPKFPGFSAPIFHVSFHAWPADFLLCGEHIFQAELLDTRSNPRCLAAEISAKKGRALNITVGRVLPIEVRVLTEKGPIY